MTRWWGPCEGCNRDSDFLALLPGTDLKVCARCYEDSRPASRQVTDPRTIKALPLWQPWATLVALGAKRIETRDYPPRRLGLHDGQRIAIHAAKRDTELWICDTGHFAEIIDRPHALPLGAIIATCRLEHATAITEDWAAHLERDNPQEHAFGNYAPGRWAWFLTDVEQLHEPVPFRGSQGTFAVPTELLEPAKEAA